MKKTVHIKVEDIVEAAVRELEPLGLVQTPTESMIHDANVFLRAVTYLVPIDSGSRYRRTEAAVLRTIAARIPENVRDHFYRLSEKHIDEVAREEA